MWMVDLLSILTGTDNLESVAFDDSIVTWRLDS